MILLQLLALVLVHFAFPIPTQLKPGDLDWDKATHQIRRLSPNTFNELPAAIIGELNQRRCTIPQSDGSPKPHNVIKGSFTGKGKIDWAVLCSHGGKSNILVFKAQSNKGVLELAAGPDNNWLQQVGEKRIGYSRRITAASGETILLYHREFGGPKPPPIDHQGIEDSFVEKGSVIFYYYNGTWLRLTGAD
jgi:hypothetical protein